ncbi:class I SAM-dependent methyltransferase [Natribacillus halophilus]|nr:class I SAM-dependent methyltransferase [Natribacillus halophilus]
MGDAPYEQWLTWTTKYLDEREADIPSIADVGCGTGTLMSMLLSRGYDVQGVDVSPEMLAIADEKIRTQNGISPRLRAQHMSFLELDQPVDVIIVYCDALNYLQDETEVQQAFHAFYKSLKPGGSLLFDVHSLYKVEQQYPGFTYGDAADELALIWNSFAGEDVPGTVEHELTFFERRADGKFARYDELHRQRTFSMAQYTDWLERAGFAKPEITADFTRFAPQTESERIFFAAAKKA